MSPAQKLLKLYAAFHACGDRHKRAELAQRYEDQLRESSQNDDFNGQMPPECLRLWIHEKWENNEHLTLEED